MHAYDNANGISSPEGHNDKNNPEKFSDRIYQGASNRFSDQKGSTVQMVDKFVTTVTSQ